MNKNILFSNISNCNTISEANIIKKNIIENPENYIKKNGNYEVKINLIIEAGPVSGDGIPAVFSSNQLDRRINFVI